ncbi:hypothetical protein BI347_17910 [Chromobacterium sphagni]|uniref:Helix-turn-helix domain-containing protein n=1 Tax=Chromobacterium sphagni TaxID=1903179 RepID=A0A1S1WW67_9NEIS|nr:hypothetical protein [Chromobacterium sphagni]OHX11538.1 hypothetical protein BI347_17910 [Chromobacterium sphagni]
MTLNTLPIPRTLSTGEFAQAIGLQPQTIRKTYSKNGHALGIRPKKLPNGKLRWLEEDIVRLLKGDAV